MRDHMVCFLEFVGALDVFQFGFRSGHSTVTALLYITNDIHGYLDLSLFVVLLLLVSPRHLIRLIMIFCATKLEHFFDFSSSAVGFIRSYLTERSQCVSAGGVLSGFLPVLRGVLQGSALGSLLFTLFINDLCRVVWSSQYHVYADDFQFNAADDISNNSLCLERVNTDLDAIHCWSIDSFSKARKHRL
jgi:ribonucleases P/MRP protein subunit RPP40